MLILIEKKKDKRQKAKAAEGEQQLVIVP